MEKRYYLGPEAQPIHYLVKEAPVLDVEKKLRRMTQKYGVEAFAFLFGRYKKRTTIVEYGEIPRPQLIVCWRGLPDLYFDFWEDEFVDSLNSRREGKLKQLLRDKDQMDVLVTSVQNEEEPHSPSLEELLEGQYQAVLTPSCAFSKGNLWSMQSRENRSLVGYVHTHPHGFTAWPSPEDLHFCQEFIHIHHPARRIIMGILPKGQADRYFGVKETHASSWRNGEDVKDSRTPFIFHPLKQ